MGKFWKWPMDTKEKFERERDAAALQGLAREPIIKSGLHVPAPSPLSATDRLQRNLERTVSESTARAEVLRLEIAAREAELADVLRAEEAARVALGNLTETELVAEEEVLEWYKGRPGEVAPLSDEDLSAACGLALEAEMTDG